MSTIRKNQNAKRRIVEEHGCDNNGNGCAHCAVIHSLIDKMDEANIPCGYWFQKRKDFTGSEKLREITNKYIEELDQNYSKGNSICFVGNQGVGKTLSSTFIMKKALMKDYSVYYITAPDLFSEMMNYGKNYETRRMLKDVDFLVIDELDSRFFTSDAQKELFGGIYENLFRYRSHNNLPTIICTNETDDILNVFSGASVQSIKSLNNQYLKVYPIAAPDFRKEMGK